MLGKFRICLLRLVLCGVNITPLLQNGAKAMEEEMVIAGYKCVVNLNLEDEYLCLSSVNGIEVAYLSDLFAQYIEAAATDAFWKEVRESRAECKINQLEDKQFFNL